MCVCVCVSDYFLKALKTVENNSNYTFYIYFVFLSLPSGKLMCVTRLSQVLSLNCSLIASYVLFILIFKMFYHVKCENVENKFSTPFYWSLTTFLPIPLRRSLKRSLFLKTFKHIHCRVQHE